MIENIEEAKAGMNAVIDRTRNAVVGAADRAESGVESAAKRVVKETHAAGDQVRAGADKASRGAHRSLESVARTIDRNYASARSDLTRAAVATTDCIARNPYKSVLFAASAGFALGSLVRSRPGDRTAR
jgi:ElaB/YqjD/DUF883 family membrane-anchored ribosome-binding protein